MKARKIRATTAVGAPCLHCGSGKLKARIFSDTVDFRGLTIDVEGLHETKCEVCTHVWTNTAQHAQNSAAIRSAYALTRDKVRGQQGLLTGPEIAQVRIALKLNQREAAALFGGGLNAFNKYESGEVLQSFAMDRLLRLAREVGASAVGFLRGIDATGALSKVPMASPRRASARGSPQKDAA